MVYMRRNLDICVISDFHLGTSGCRADELLHYLQSIEPVRIILNGDIFDAWQFKKRYFPQSHWEVIERIIQMANTGTMVYYLTGNHDGPLRRFNAMDLGNICIRNQLQLRIREKSYWFFHGDIFDASVFISPWLAAWGGRGYDYLIGINAWINRVRTSLGYPKISFAHKVKHSVKHALKYISDFEKSAIEDAIKKKVDVVVCGHIHKPCIQIINNAEREITYMNSGDWIENMTALELKSGKWRLYRHGVDDQNDLEEFLSHLEDDQYLFGDKRKEEEGQNIL